MSGRKVSYVSVADTELRQLREAQSRLAQVRSDLPTVLAGVRRDTRADLDRYERDLARRQRAFDTTLAAMSERVRAAERDSQHRVTEQSRQLTRALDAATGDLRAALREQDARLDQALAAEATARQQQVAHVAQELAELAADVHGQQATESRLAAQWLADAAHLRDFIAAELPHERFAPAQLAGLIDELAIAEANGRAGLHQAALAGAQASFRRLSDLRTTLELRDSEWHALRRAAHEAMLVLRQVIRTTATVPAVGQSGEQLDHDLDVDLWTHGRLGDLQADVERVLGQLDEPADPLGTDELRRLVEQEAPRMRERTDALVQEAATAQLASQLRANIADQVVTVLEESGYDLAVEGTYEGGDMRAGFVAKARHEDGSTVVVTVLPVPGRPGEAELGVHSFDVDTRAEEIRRDRAHSLAVRLREAGLHCADLVAAGDTADHRLLDLSAIRDAAPGTVTSANPQQARDTRAGTT